MTLKLDQPQANISIADGQGKITLPFSRLLLQWKNAIETAFNGNEEADAQLAAIVRSLQATQQATQQAQQAANTAQGDTDTASGDAKTGQTTGYVNLSGTTWQTGPSVSLTALPAGTLTITGSGPQQDATTTGPEGLLFYSGFFRIVEVVLGVDTVVFTGAFTVEGNKFEGPTINNNSVADVAAFSSARSSTGTVDYRIDARLDGPGTVDNLSLYLFVRRTL